MKKEISDRYEPKDVEKKWIELWEKNSSFLASTTNKENFSIVIPPPNITGSLHIGHALEHTLIDIITRIERKKGKNTVWVPGTDHAGIAAQLVVEKNLRKSGKTRTDFSREEFEKMVWDWKKESGGQIVHQQRMLGESVDWSRERFTMEESLNKSVIKVFKSLYDEGLIYRGERIINWCPVTKTAISDLEVEFKEVKGKLYHIRYQVKDSSEYIVVATTRPETLFGDVAVCASPDDERYKHLKGKTLILPILNKEIPLLFDSFVDKEFGSGLVKITPAHDANDFEAGIRLGLKPVLIMNIDGTLNELTGIYNGIDRFKAREQVITDLEKLNQIEKIEDYTNQVGHNQRGGAVIEPYLSKQWFVKIKPLAEKAIDAVRSGEIEFIPKNWEKTYFEWMENIRDWCISRQLWWGHRIPAFYFNEEMIVASSIDEAYSEFQKKFPDIKKEVIKQDEDVLDTWFSSGLWPFTVFGWPEKTEDYKLFYPTSVLVTGFDIIFFWVARMIMFGLKFNDGKPPFKKVLIHGLVRDKDGKKFSKTLGNTIDPLLLMEKHGTDAFRFFLAASMPEGKDMLFDESRLEGYKFFCNKIWNSTRFILMNLEENFSEKKLVLSELEAIDIWILNEFDECLKNYEKAYSNFHFFEMASSIYDFIWGNFCDWYIELVKPRIYGKSGETSKQISLQVLVDILKKSLGLLHPFMPFITEEIYSVFSKNFMTKEKFPDLFNLNDESKLTKSKLIIEIISKTRTTRSELSIPPEKKCKLVLSSNDNSILGFSDEEKLMISSLAKAEEIIIDINYKKIESDSVSSFSKGEIILPLAGLLDFEKEKQRLYKELNSLKLELEKIKKKLTNEEFISKAKPEIIAKEKEKENSILEKMKSVESSMEKFK